jgi:Zn-dependent alcohol dehydrogenase
LNIAAVLSGELPLEQIKAALDLMIAGHLVKIVINPDL